MSQVPMEVKSIHLMSVSSTDTKIIAAKSINET